MLSPCVCHSLHSIFCSRTSFYILYTVYLILNLTCSSSHFQLPRHTLSVFFTQHSIDSSSYTMSHSSCSSLYCTFTSPHTVHVFIQIIISVHNTSLTEFSSLHTFSPQFFLHISLSTSYLTNYLLPIILQSPDYSVLILPISA